MKKLVLLLMSLSGVCCNMHSTTSHTSATTDREVKNFDAIEVEGGIDVYLVQGADESVSVNATSDELLERTRTEVENGMLKIYLENKGWSFNSMGNGKVRVTVTFKDIDKIEASGACNVKANNTIKEKELKIDLSGASEFLGDVEV